MASPGLSEQWIRKRQPHWTRLESLIDATSRRGVAALAHSELRELVLLYRQTAADLARARAASAGNDRATYLNGLLGRAHNLLYTAEPRRRFAALRFYVSDFPQVFRATWQYTAAATAILLSGAVLGVLLVWADPGFERFVLGGAMIDTIDRHEMWTHSIVGIKPLASSFIMTNNLAVAFAACAGGIFAGLGSTYIMAMNGLLLGVVGAACQRAGLSLSLWSFVAPHGVLELPAIIIAGGAGLILARGILVPGHLSRRDALSDAARTAIRLLLGVIPLLVVAGVIEGFLSPTAAPPASKFAVGLALSMLLTLYLARAGRAAAVTAGPRP